MVEVAQIAVVIPVYNGEKTILRALSSLINQTYKNWHCYIVNDGSTDKTYEILENINDSRFTIHHFDKNLGRASARQKCLDIAQGDFLAFLDADDFYHPEKLELQVKMFINCNLSLVFTKIGSFDKDLVLRTSRGKSIDTNYNGIVHASSMIKLSSAKQLKYNKLLNQGEDLDFLKRYLSVCDSSSNSVQCIDRILYYYSEYEYNSKEKIIKASYYDIVKNLTNREYCSAIKSIALMISKFFILPFVSIDWLTSKRGLVVKSCIEHEQFNECVRRFKIDL